MITKQVIHKDGYEFIVSIIEKSLGINKKKEKKFLSWILDVDRQRF